MKSDYHRGTILLTNGIHNNIQLHEKPRHHISSVSVIEPNKSTATILTSSGSSSGKTVVGYTNGSQVKGSGNMSVHEDPRITHKVNLAAAFHDHISCTKLPSQISKNGGDISSLIGASLNNGSCIDTNNSLFGAAAGSSNEDKIQIKKLKEMILMQLDLIQHQQEQLLKKERQLQGLKHDRETLCLKIDKMENRITFLTRKLLEANSTENTATPSINENNTHPESINELNAHSSDSEVMISCLNDTNDVSNMFTTVYSTPSPPSTTNPTIVSPITNSSQPVASSNQSLQATCGTQTISTGDIEEISDKSKPKTPANNTGEKKVKVNSVKTEIKKEDVSVTEKKNNSKETKKSTKKRKRPSTSSTTSSTLSTTTTTTTSTSTAASVTTSTSSTTTTTTTTSKNVSPQVNKDDLLVTTDKPVNNESSNEEISTSQSSSSSKKRRRTVSKSGSGSSSTNPSDQQQPVNNVNCKSISTNVNVLETDEPYDLYNCRQEKSVIQRMENSSRDTVIKISQIEVPSWRIIDVPDSDSTDGIENLDDDTYLKRHQKLENDERRRKRWDIQRLREQKLNEKLRSGRYYYSAVNFDKPPCTAGQSKQITLDLISFFQDPKEVQFIEVSDKIPVMAFGLPIPKLPPKHFTLPWLKASRQP